MGAFAPWVNDRNAFLFEARAWGLVPAAVATGNPFFVLIAVIIQ